MQKFSTPPAALFFFIEKNKISKEKYNCFSFVFIKLQIILLCVCAIFLNKQASLTIYNKTNKPHTRTFQKTTWQCFHWHIGVSNQQFSMNSLFLPIQVFMFPNTAGKPSSQVPVSTCVWTTEQWWIKSEDIGKCETEW